MAEANVERSILVRQVTNVHANWSEEARGEPGKFSYQLILDNGAEEYAVGPPPEGAGALIERLNLPEKIYFEGGRQFLSFGNIPLGD